MELLPIGATTIGNLNTPPPSFPEPVVPPRLGAEIEHAADLLHALDIKPADVDTPTVDEEQHDHDDEVGVPEFCEIVGLHQVTVYEYIRRGVIPKIKRGKRTWFLRSIAETIRDLVRTHGKNQWFKHLPEDMRPIRHEVPDDAVIGRHNDLFNLAVERARLLQKQGRHDAGLELILFIHDHAFDPA